MRRILLKTSYVAGVLLLLTVLLVPAQLLLEWALPDHRPGGDRLLPGILVIVACVAVADRTISFVFGRLGLAAYRVSVFGSAQR
jgi:hypothetical protein